MRYGFSLRTQLFGPAAAVIHYNCFPLEVAFRVCRFWKVPCVWHYDDSGKLGPKILAQLASQTLTKCNGELVFLFKKRMTEASSISGFLGLTASSRDGCEDVIASLALSKENIRKVIDVARELGKKGQHL